ALAVLDEVAPDARVINLETSVTRSADFAVGKAVHYRMSPDNLPAVTVAHPDVCVLANNHVLDFGRAGLAETLGALAAASGPAAGGARGGVGAGGGGAGRCAAGARQPAGGPAPGGGRGGGPAGRAPPEGTPAARGRARGAAGNPLPPPPVRHRRR